MAHAYRHRSRIVPSSTRPHEVPDIRQIAALTYRAVSAAPDAAVEVLLVTSRGTGRWVLPKGNLSKRMPPHAAAAREAHEEAGVEGAIGVAPVGAYRYHKVLDSGASRLVDVDVYPFAVTAELDDWPERAERERRWFALADAAAAVDEADLADLIRAFRERTPAEGGWHRG